MARAKAAQSEHKGTQTGHERRAKGGEKKAVLGHEKGHPVKGAPLGLLGCQGVSLCRTGTRAPSKAPSLETVFRHSFSFARSKGHSMAMASGTAAKLKCAFFCMFQAIGSHTDNFTFACPVQIAGHDFYEIRFHAIWVQRSCGGVSRTKHGRIRSPSTRARAASSDVALMVPRKRIPLSV